MYIKNDKIKKQLLKDITFIKYIYNVTIKILKFFNYQKKRRKVNTMLPLIMINVLSSLAQNKKQKKK